MARYFLTRTTVGPGAFVEVAGTPALERYDVLVQSLEGVADPESIGVLAEPLVSHGNDVAPATVVWYSSYPGEPQRLAELDPERREALLSTLRARLAEIGKGLSSPDFGPLAGAALNVLDADDVYVVDGQPVLVGWGMVPAEANASAAARNRHFARSMARHLPLAEAPPVTPAEWRSRQAAAPAEAQAGSAAPAARGAADAGVTPRSAGPADATAEEAGGGVPPPPRTDRGMRGGGWRWLPLGLLLLISVAALVWLFWPGTRVMPPVPAVAFVADEEALEIAREANAALEERASQLEEAITGARCAADGQLVLPDGRTPEGLLVPPAEDGAWPGVREARPDALIPPDPNRVDVLPEARGGEAEAEDPATLLDLIDSRTALVLAVGEASGTGTGFFVGPELLVTSDHVVADASGGIYVVNGVLGRARAAEVLDRLGPLGFSGGPGRRKCSIGSALLRPPEGILLSCSCRGRTPPSSPSGTRPRPCGSRT